MATDLTRFDFHAMRFWTSEAVESMKAEEVGQYILLLCKAWILGKDTSLPNDMSYLSSAAKGKVSEKVLNRFPVVETEWGPRRRNDVLYEEWLAANLRSTSARKSVESRWNNERNTNVSRTNDERNTNDIREEIGRNTSSYTQSSQASQSNQIKSNQGSGDFHNIAIKYRTAMGRGHSKAKTVRAKYAEVCSQFGEDAVLTAFEEWAESNQWRKDNLGNSGLRFFFSDLGDIIEETKAVAALKPKETVVSEDEVERINREANEQALKDLEPLKKKIREEEAAAEKLRSAPFAC